jgi:hypothetical protein
LTDWFGRRTHTDSSSRVRSFSGRLADTELVTRFIHESNKIAKGGPIPRVKPGAFQPPPDLMLSTAHVTQLGEAEVWAIGRRTLNPRRRKLYGRADLRVAEYEKGSLIASRDNDEFERHTVVTGWPNPSDPDARKPAILAVCLELCHADSINVVALDEPIVLAD